MPFSLGQGFICAAVNQVNQIKSPCASGGKGGIRILCGDGLRQKNVYGVGLSVTIVESINRAEGCLRAVGRNKHTPPIRKMQRLLCGKNDILRGGDANKNLSHIAVGFHGFHFQRIAVLGRFLRRRRLRVHVGLGGDVRLDGKVQSVGNHVQLLLRHMLIFGGYHTGVFAEKFRVHVQPYGHQRVSPVTDDIAPLLTGGGQNQYGVPGGGGVVPLHPVAPVFQREIFPAEGVLSVPVERAAGVGHFIALIFREDEAQKNEEVSAITAKALTDINADVLTVPDEPFHAQGVAQIPGGAKCQRLPLRL